MVLSRAEFLDRVSELIARHFPELRLEREEADFGLRINGHWGNLEHLYRTVVGDGHHATLADRLSAAVQQWVRELLTAAANVPRENVSLEQVRDRIMPMVVPTGPGKWIGDSVVSQSLVEGLRVAYAMDSERAISYVPRATFKHWRISLDELHEVAISNLVARSQSLEVRAAQDEAGRISLMLIQTLDGYDASRLLLPTLHERLREHLGRTFVAAIPNRDILVCCRDDQQTLQRVTAQVKEDYQRMPHALTDQLFLVTADGIAPYGSL